MRTKKPKVSRGDQAALIRRLMIAAGLSDESCRQNLINKTRPKNPLVAEAWDAAMEAASAPQKGGAHARP